MESSPALSCIVTRCASCSTPCGINGIITLSYAEQHCTCMRCSTPCGINGIITKSVEVKLIDKDVLNALRHQWNHHSVGSKLLAYKELRMALRDTQLLASLMELSQAENPLCRGRKALKTKVFVDTHGPRLSLQQQIALSIRGLAALVVPCRVVHAEILAS